MAGIISCTTLPKTFPKMPPSPTLKQTLYRQTICDSNGNCDVYDKCQYWKVDSNGNFVKTGSGPIKNSDMSISCHGSFGLSAEEITKFREWVKSVKKWGETNCGSTSN